MRVREALRLCSVFVLAVSAVRAEAGFSGSDVFVPATARASGAGGSQYYSTLWITNLGGASANVRVQFLRQGQTNPSPTTKAEVIAAGATRRIDDVVTYLGEAGGGALHVISDQEVFVSSRTYDQPPGAALRDVKALFFSGIPAGFSIGAGDVSRLQGITNGPLENYRYNFGLVETTGHAVTARVTVKDQDGASLGIQQYDLGAWEARQVNAFAGFSPAISTSNALLLAEVLGGNGRVILYGTQIAGTSDVPGSNDSAGFEMSFKDSLLGTGGVTSLNGLTGAVTIAGGNNTTVTRSGNTITLDAAGAGGGGMTSVSHDGTLAGNGTSGAPLAVAAPLSLAAVGDVVTATSISGGAAGFYGVAEGPSGSGVHGRHSLSGSDGYLGTKDIGVLGNSSGTGTIAVGGMTQDGVGVYGNSGSGAGVVGSGNTGAGVLGFSEGEIAVKGESTRNHGVVGKTSGMYAAGVIGYAAGGTIGYLGGFQYGVFSHGAFLGDGAKYFVEPHPTDPTKEIRYVCLEGRESGTYFRGTARIAGGTATVEVPEDFRIVTSATGLTVQVTPNGELAVLACVSKDLDRIVVRGSADVEFDYLVHGVRRAFEGQEPVVPNQMFVPRSKDDPFAKALPAESVRRLVANGTLNEDGTVNLETARRLGWDARPEWRAKEAAGLR